MNVPAIQRTVSDLIAEYDDKAAKLDRALQNYKDAETELEMAATVQGVFAGPVFDRRPHVTARSLQKNLCKSGWRCLYNRLQIDRIATAKDKKLFERTIESPPELTFENAKATFGDYLLRPRFHILRGLAETFADLDPAYKSHSKVKIGVKGLPKRVIVSNVGSWGSYGRDKIRDMISALAAYRGDSIIDNDEFKKLDDLHSFMGSKAGEVVMDGSHHIAKDDDGVETRAPDRGVTIRKYQNGNAHVIFTPAALLDINRALAEFYGDVLPDAEEEGATLRPGTDVAKDLQFYGSPEAVIRQALDFAGIPQRDEFLRQGAHTPLKVLEPSCGDGRIMDELFRRGCDVFGIEVHAARAAQARAKGHAVLTANFLECPPVAEYDVVVMNPPFYGRHYVKHVRHALKFLKPKGRLVAVLPATARYDHGELDGQWQDLPVASFAESGTNVPTCLFKTLQGRTA